MTCFNAEWNANSVCVHTGVNGSCMVYI